MKLPWALFWSAVLASSGLAEPAEGAEGKLKGYMFGDYYYIASGAREKQNGFQFRRIYLTCDLKWDDRFSGRLRLEARDAGFGKKDKMVPFVKHAYLRSRKNDRALYFGLAGTPTWNVSERVWGYRSIQKTVMDLHKIGSSADLGVAFKGKLDEGGKVHAQVMLGNGSGQSPEVDNGKKVYVLLHLKPTGTFEATAYVDREGKAGGKDRITYAGFVGMSGKIFHGGIEGFVRTSKDPGGNVKVSGISAFGAGKVRPGAKLFGRFDIYDPSDQAGDDREFLIIGGVDLMPAKHIHVMPNVVATSFQASGVDAEVIPRVTVYYKF